MLFSPSVLDIAVSLIHGKNKDEFGMLEVIESLGEYRPYLQDQYIQSRFAEDPFSFIPVPRYKKRQHSLISR